MLAAVVSDDITGPCLWRIREQQSLLQITEDEFTEEEKSHAIQEYEEDLKQRALEEELAALQDTTDQQGTLDVAEAAAPAKKKYKRRKMAGTQADTQADTPVPGGLPSSGGVDVWRKSWSANQEPSQAISLSLSSSDSDCEMLPVFDL